jgi:hypothetical protein
MAIVTVLTCDECGVDSSLRVVRSYRLDIVLLPKKGSGRRGRRLAASTVAVQFCNPCAEANIARAIVSMKARLAPKYEGAPKVEIERAVA